MSLSLVSYVCKAAIRDKLVISMLTLIALSASLSIFMASAASVEQDQFSAVFSAGSLRIVGVLGLVLFVCFFIRRSFDSKDVEFLLSRPIGRLQFLLSYALAFSLLAVLVGLACGLSLFAISPTIYSEGFVLWGLSLIIENIIMVNIAFFFSMMLASAATAVLAVLAFYVLGRMMGEILGIIDTGATGMSNAGLEMIMNVVSVITPRLDLLGQTSWLLYGAEIGVGFTFVMIQGAVFLFMVLCAALIDLFTRQF